MPVGYEDKITIKGVPGFDGTYVLDLGQLNGHEYHLIKQVSDVRANALDAAIWEGDTDVYVALAAIALRRSGHAQADGAVEALMDSAVAHTVKLEVADRLNGGGDGPDPHQPTASE